MKNNSIKNLTFEGLFLGEALEQMNGYLEPNVNIILVVDKDDRVRRDYCEKRSDGGFGFKVEYTNFDKTAEFNDLIVELLSHPETPARIFDAVWETLNTYSNIGATDELYIRSMLNNLTIGIDRERTEAERAGSQFYTPREVKNEPSELAKQLSEVLHHPDLPEKIYDAIQYGFNDICNAAKSGAMDELDSQPQRIEQILSLAKETDPPKETSSPEASKVLDLSEHPENLNILAGQLSDILKNPALPTEIYNCISDELTHESPDLDSPELILKNLEAIQQRKTKEE